MRHLIKSAIILLLALGLFALTLVLAEGLIKDLVQKARVENLAQPLIYTAMVAAYFDILALLVEVLPISQR